MIESIASNYTAMAQAQLMQQAQTSVRASAIDTVESQGQAVADLLSVASVAGLQEVFTDPLLG